MLKLMRRISFQQVSDQKYFTLKRKTFLHRLIGIIRLIFVLFIPGVLYAEQDSPAFTQKGSFELGGILGTPSGLNSRYWITDRIGLDGSAGVSLDKYPVFTIDLLADAYRLYRSSTWESRFFIGFGGLFAKEEGDFKNNLRIPIGLSFPLLRYPLSFSFYIAPALAINPEKEYEFNWGIGFRYNFTSASAMRARQDNLEWEVGKLERNVEGLKHGLDTTKGKLAQTEGELSSTKGKLGDLTERLGNIKERLDKATGELETTKGKLDTARVELYTAKGELDVTKSKLYLTTKELDDTKNQLDDVQSELKNTKKTLDDKQSELNKKRIELDKAKNIIENTLIGKEKEEEEKKLVVRQKELDQQFTQLKSEKKEWEQIRVKEAQRREQLKKKCEDRGGIIDENGYCSCPENQEWDPRTDKCVCIKGYHRQKPGGDCKPCEVIKQNGECAEGGCEENEDKVRLVKGPHKYVCVKKCRKNNEIWSKGKKTCVCKDGYYRNDKGDCVPRQ